VIRKKENADYKKDEKIAQISFAKAKGCVATICEIKQSFL